MPLFLADENCDFSVVRALRSAGYDVLAVAEIAPQAPDHDVIDLAVRDGRVLLTEDKDFGQLVYAELRRSSGVILIRFPASERDVLPATILDAVTELQDRLARVSGERRAQRRQGGRRDGGEGAFSRRPHLRLEPILGKLRVRGEGRASGDRDEGWLGGLVAKPFTFGTYSGGPHQGGVLSPSR